MSGLLAALLGSCAPAAEPVPTASAPATPRPAPKGPRLEFSYVALDGTAVSSVALRDRLTVIGLLASYDPSSQTQAIYLRALARRYRPRINILIVVLEPPDNLPLVQAFADVLAAPFPVALADEPTLLGRGPFGDLREVPSLVVLDRDGREAWRHIGQVDPPGLEAVLRSLGRPGDPARVGAEPGVGPAAAEGAPAPSSSRTP